MTSAQLILKSLRFYWRTNLGVIAGCALASGILIGALVVGDSVRFSLERMALLRLGKTELALLAPEVMFRDKLADDIGARLNAIAAPVLLQRGVASSADGSARANSVQVIGVDDRFWQLGSGDNPLEKAMGDEVVVNERLARQLRLRVGDSVVVRVEEPSLVSRDAPLSGGADGTVAMRLRVRAIAMDDQLGRFGLRANQVSPHNVFLPLASLQAKLRQASRVNGILLGTSAKGSISESDAADALNTSYTLLDAGLDVREVPRAGQLEIRASRVFLLPSTRDVVSDTRTDSFPVLTYLVNDIRNGDRSTPYSMATAVDPRGTDFLPPDLGSDEVVINFWLARDLDARAGDSISLRYFVVTGQRGLREESMSFRVRTVIPLEGAAADSSWMPDYPGLADVDNCRDWNPGIPIDTLRIRPKDEEYWNEHRGAPKAFVSYATGQRLWGNRFGDLTALRVPSQEVGREALVARLEHQLEPEYTGLKFRPVREQAIAASREAMDFGQLFLGFSFFLIVAALLLTAMLFVFNVEQRGEEVGTLLAMGFRPSRVRRLLWVEGGLLALVGTALGVVLGPLYTKLTLHGLDTVWQRAVGGHSDFRFHAEPVTIAIGALASFLVAVSAIAWVSRKQVRRPAARLLAGDGGGEAMQRTGGRGAWWVVAGSVLASIMVLVSVPNQAAAFFGSGALLLVAGVGIMALMLARFARGRAIARTLAAIGFRAAARRRGRSLTLVAVLASGVFLVVAVNAFRHDPNAEARERNSGTGGFALYAESTVPIHENLNSPPVRESLGLDNALMQGVSIVSLRVHEGDEASCLNLNKPQSPRILGVPWEELENRHAFSFAAEQPRRWAALDRRAPDGGADAIGDTQTLTWSLKKKSGDHVSITADRGEPRDLRIVGVIAASILQGSLLIAEDKFIELFPSSAGYRVFLIDAPWEQKDEIAKTLSRALRDKGFSVVPTTQRLAEFMAVENTYLAIFQALGGLGLLLGSAGLGIVVLRNVLERRGELALLQAVGFRKKALRGLVQGEHWLLVLLGVVLGTATACVAVWPALRSPGAEVPVGSLIGLLVAILGSGMIWVWLAVVIALRGSLLAALRNE